MASKTLSAIAPWFGGKRSMAPLIVDALGVHRSYWEPFCGSMAVLFSKPISSQETVCDLHGDLINLARVLACEMSAVQLYEASSRILYSTELFEDFRRRADANDFTNTVDRAVTFLVLSWMGRNGTSGSVRTNFAPSIRFTPGGGDSATRWRAAVESIPSWHSRLRRVVILHHDAFAIIPKIADMEGVAIYCDPPYMLDTRGNGGGSRYLHDFTERDAPLFGESDEHGRLAEMLRKFTRARVVVSYYDCPRVRQLYDGWSIREATRQKNLHVQNRRGVGDCEAPELIISNATSGEDE